MGLLLRAEKGKEGTKEKMHQRSKISDVNIMNESSVPPRKRQRGQKNGKQKTLNQRANTFDVNTMNGFSVTPWKTIKGG